VDTLPTLVVKALIDSGYDLLSPATEGWFTAAISGATTKVAVRAMDTGTLLAAPESGVMARIGLPPAAYPLPLGMTGAGIVAGPAQLYEALRLLHSLQTHPVATLSARMEARLAAIPATERTREVRQRIGQDVFREALLELWEGRCALSGIALPPSLLRASHAKPWTLSDEREKLDPFNGLLLAVHYDALFDQGLVTFDDDGHITISSSLSQEARKILRLDDSARLRFILPGHIEYLRFHRANIAKS
jgi:hypothetical protein